MIYIYIYIYRIFGVTFLYGFLLFVSFHSMFSMFRDIFYKSSIESQQMSLIVEWNNLQRKKSYRNVTPNILYIYHPMLPWRVIINSLRHRQNGHHFVDDIFTYIFVNENVWFSIKISPMFVPKGPINYIPALFQVMAWRLPGGKPLSEPMMVILLTHVWVIRPQWVYSSYVQLELGMALRSIITRA